MSTVLSDAEQKLIQEGFDDPSMIQAINGIRAYNMFAIERLTKEEFAELEAAGFNGVKGFKGVVKKRMGLAIFMNMNPQLMGKDKETTIAKLKYYGTLTKALIEEEEAEEAEEEEVPPPPPKKQLKKKAAKQNQKN